MPEKPFYEIPENLLNLVQSEDTALKIAEICFDNGIEEDEKIREIAYQTGRVLLGDLSPEEFLKSLTEKVKLSSFLANQITREINESIFGLVKDSLAALYKEEVSPAERPTLRPLPEATPPQKEKPEIQKGTDVYRESLE